MIPSHRTRVRNFDLSELKFRTGTRIWEPPLGSRGTEPKKWTSYPYKQSLHTTLLTDTERPKRNTTVYHPRGVYIQSENLFVQRNVDRRHKSNPADLLDGHPLRGTSDEASDGCGGTSPTHKSLTSEHGSIGPQMNRRRFGGYPTSEKGVNGSTIGVPEKTLVEETFGK